MSDMIERFFAAWGEEDPDRRALEIKDAMAPQIYYADPNAPEQITDPDALVPYVGTFTEYAPGATARVAHLVECKGFHRATVIFKMTDGKQQTGQYFVNLNAEGRITLMIGFVGLGEPD